MFSATSIDLPDVHNIGEVAIADTLCDCRVQFFHVFLSQWDILGILFDALFRDRLGNDRHAIL